MLQHPKRRNSQQI